MKKQFIKNTLSVALMLGMAACSDNDGNQSIDVQGQVIDGYLENALVCLDINDNDSCDANEPSQRTNSMGEYSFQAGKSDSKQYRVIAVIDAETRDSDNVNADGSNTTVLADAMYSTPPGKRLLSPLTTLVDHELRSATSGASIMALEDKVKEALSLDMSVSLFSDHVAMAKTDTKYIQVHNIAKVVAKSLGMPTGDESGETQTNILKARVESIKSDLDGQAHFMAKTVDYDSVPKMDMAMMMAGMAHLSTELESFDVVMEHDMATMRAGMAHLLTELESFDPSDMSGMNGMSGMGAMPGMDGMSSGTMADAISECPEGQSWYEKGTYPGMPDMMSMCMPDVDDMPANQDDMSGGMDGMSSGTMADAIPECPEGQRWYTENEIPGMMAMCM